jgi:protein-tyrosine phosphatase
MKVSLPESFRLFLHMVQLKVLMVCLGNICRSPMAEGWLKQKIDQYKLPIATDSAGTANYHVGEKPDVRMRKHALEYGCSIESLRARQFVQSDFDHFDIIFVMDASNYENVLRLSRNENDTKKVRFLLNELEIKSNAEVPDPFYGNEQDFKHVIELLDKATEAFLKNEGYL